MINLSTLRDRMSRKFSTGGTRFDSAFLDAVNDVSTDLRRECFLDVADIETTTDQLDLEAKYTPAYRDGVAYYIQSSGEFQKEPDDKLGMRYRNALAQCQFLAIDELDPTAGTPLGSW